VLDYIKKQEDGLLLQAQDGGLIVMDEPISKILNLIAYTRLSTLDARIRTTKKIFHVQTRIPVWLTEKVLLIPLCGIRSEKMCLINYFAVRSFRKIKKTQTIALYFWDGLILSAVPAALFQNRIAVCEQIIRHMNAQ